MNKPQHHRTPRRSLGATPTPAPMTASVRIELPPRLDVESVAKLYQLLSPLANQQAMVIVVADGVSHVHESALRVLAAFFRVRSAGGETTRLHNPSETLRVGASHAGLAAPLGLAGA
jgi:anti-anti-sigma regulatory factor